MFKESDVGVVDGEGRSDGTKVGEGRPTGAEVGVSVFAGQNSALLPTFRKRNPP